MKHLHKARRYLASLLLIVISWLAAHGQGNLFNHNFLPIDYPGKTQNWAIEIDTNNVVWVGNQDGLMSFNGASWQMIQTPQKSTIRSLGFDSKGRLYAGGIADFGFVADSASHQTFVSLRNKIPEGVNFNDVWNTLANKDQVVFLTDNYLFHYINDTIYINVKTQQYYYLAYKVSQKIFVQQIGGGLYLAKKNNLIHIKNSQFFAQKKVHAILALNGFYLICTKNHGLFKAQFDSLYTTIVKIEPFYTQIDSELKSHSLYQAKIINNNQLAFATTNNGLYITDMRGNVKQHLSSSNQLITDAIYDIAMAHDGTLWLAQDMGLSIIETGLPITYYDHHTGIKGSVSEIVKFNQYLYVTTGFGLYVLDENAPFEQRNFEKIKNLNRQAWSITKMETDNEQNLFITSSEGIYKIEKNKALKVFDYTDTYVLYQYAPRPEYVFAGTRNGILLLEKTNESWKLTHEFSNINQQVRDIASDNTGKMWFAINYKGFAHFTESEINELIDQQIAPVLHVKDTAHGIENLRDIQFQETDSELIFLSLPNRFLYEPDADRFKQLNDSLTSNEPFNQPSLHIENQIIRFAHGHTKFTDSITLKRLPYNITNATIADSLTLWIGTENGIYAYQTQQQNSKTNQLQLLTEKLKIGNHTWMKIYDQKTPIDTVIPFNSNSIAISVAVPYYYNFTQNKISFFLEGFDVTYEPFHQQFQKTYTNLPPGRYRLFAKAQNTFGQTIERNLLNLHIPPPFYRTPLAYTAYLIIWIAAMLFAIRYRTKKLRKSHEKLETIVKERTKQLLDRNEEVMQVADILKENNKKLKELSIVAEKAGNAVAIFDKNGKLDYCNQSFESLYGYSCTEFIKERGDTLFNNSEYPHIRNAFKECIETKRSVQYEYFTISKNHTGLWIHTTLTPVYDGDELPERFIAIDTNITQLKNAEEEVRFQKEELERKSKELANKNQELTKLSIIARETDNAVLLTDKIGQILWLNEGFTRLYGYTIEDLKSGGKNVFSLSSNQKIGEYISNWPDNQSSITYESKNLTSTGKEIWAQTTLTPIKNEMGEISQIIAIDSDITALKNAETQIQNQRDQLKILNATKDKFFSIIGHDLRSPFGNFVNMSNIIMQNITTADTATLISYVSKLHRSAQNSYNLLENLLDWARHQQGRIKVIPDFVDITGVVEEMTDLLLPLAEGKKIKVNLTYQEPIYAYFDEQMIKTVVRNILFNALKFTPSGGDIDIYFTDENDRACLYIKDSGIGISMDAQTKLFRPDTHFSTLGTEKERGTGLGLILSKDFIEMNHGSISVESQPGKGSTFKICIPKKSI